MTDVREEGQEKRLPPFSHMARWCSLSKVFRELRALCVRRTPLYVGCWLYPSGSKLLPPEVTSARVMFFREKCPPPLSNGLLLGGGLRKVIFFFIVEATRANFAFLEKRLPPFLRAVVSGGCRMMDAEGSDRKTSPPFLASVFRFFRGFLVLLSLALGAFG